jgi:hypothetical protein
VLPPRPHARSHYDQVAPALFSHPEDLFGIEPIGNDHLMFDSHRGNLRLKLSRLITHVLRLAAGRRR